MNTEKQKTNVIFCGLPSSGKTTFLGALSYLASNNEVEKDLNLIAIPKERHFFNRLATTWVNCDPMSRTLISSTDKIEMTLEKNDQSYVIEMPDLSGETWRELWTEHTLDLELHPYLKNTNGIIFFIHADSLIIPMSIKDEQDIIRCESIMDTDTCQSWNPSKHTPTQSIVVDILRKISVNIERSSVKLAIVLSAWDMLPHNTSPIDFMDTELPLLSQYLNNKFDYEQVEIFGVSAQGGNLENEDEVDRLLDEDEPSKRILVTKNGKDYSQDLTQILSWLINE